MRRSLAWSWMCVVVMAVLAHGGASPSGSGADPIGRLDDPNSFPIAVWLQNPARAGLYRAAGINLYVGLWKGPTEDQLRSLKQAGMSVICHQNEVGLAHVRDATIVGWMHGDEPDNAQSLGEGKGYGPPIPPETIVQGYERMRAMDPSRPVLLNLGQGVAWDGWYGRGVRTNHPEDYPAYVRGCDIASFDIYPVTHPRPEISGKLWTVAQGVERLVAWAGPSRRVWNCIECTRISDPKHKPTPHQVRCEVWMSIVHGSHGLIYFVHEWQPRFNEAALLSDPNMLAAVTALNRRIQGLAPVLNSPSLSGGPVVASSDAEVPVAAVMKKHAGSAHIFAVAMRDQATRATFTIQGLTGTIPVTVLDEGRTLECRDGVWVDDFQPWDVHLYRIPISDFGLQIAD